MRATGLLILVLSCVIHWTHATVSDSFITNHQDQLDRTVNSLDSSIPALQEIVSIWEEGNGKRAMEELVRYFRGKQFDISRMGTPDMPHDFVDQAMLAKDDTFRIHGAWIKVPRTPDGQLVWDYRGESNDKEIAWMLNRHSILPIVAMASRQLQDPELKTFLNRTLTDWILSSPYPDRITFSAQWRPLEAARRVLNSWVHVFYGSTALLDDETILLMLASVQDHADALLEHSSFWGGNHLLTEKIALLAVASAWPEFEQSRHWRISAIEKVHELLQQQCYPDGSYKELSNHYQRVVLSNTMPFLGLIGSEGVEHPTYSKVLDMWEFFAWSTKPDGSGPVNNASDREMNASFIKAASDWFDRPEWLGIATNGREGVLPTGSPSRLFPWAGQVFIRNNWSRSADWIYFDAGPYGTAHQHLDRLHLSVSLDGRNLLSDSGRYTYKPGKWRDYFKGPRSHSVVLLNGQPAMQGPREVESPMDVAFHEGKDAVYASASAVFHPGNGLLRAPVSWTRDVVYDKRGLVIVLDHIDALKRYDVDVLWQFSDGISKQEAQSIVQCSHPFLLKESIASIGREEDPISGFFSPDYSMKIPTVQICNKFSIHSPTTIAHVIQSPRGEMKTVQTIRDRQAGKLHFIVFEDGEKLSEGEIIAGKTRRLASYKTYAVER